LGYFWRGKIQSSNPSLLSRYRKYSHYLDADAAILTYDLTKISSLDGVEYYKQELEEKGPVDMGINSLTIPSHQFSRE